ncbi:MAG: hypothetical protein HRU70_10710 [Phycisphaeraceae bacterium]|nr:MAG: hypothetical protein HRU70_10710 [Phycisphaeraceae bacterium]
MNKYEVQMCVMDCLLDDDVESLPSLMQALNDEDPSSWRIARGQAFSVEEVQAALQSLSATGHVTQFVEEPPDFRLRPITSHDVGLKNPWESIWFHLERKGREEHAQWWEDEGRRKYPKR